MDQTAYACIDFLDESSDKFTKLKVSGKEAYRTFSLSFNVWNKDKLRKCDGTLFGPGDEVKVIYYKRGDFNVLRRMIEETLIDCPTCGASLPITSAQRIDCGKCCRMGPEERKERVNGRMEVIESEETRYTYSMGRKLSIQGPQQVLYTVIFPSNRLYPTATSIKRGDYVTVDGWIKTSRILDLFHISKC